MSTRIGLVLLASLLGAGCAVDREVTRANDERALHELWRRFERAFNDGDAETAASVYAPDADRISSSGELVTGRDEIQKRYAAMLARRSADPSTVPFHAEIRVRLLTAEVALLDGTWSGVRDGGTVRGFFTLTAMKCDGQWLIVAGRDRGVIRS